MLPYIEIGPRIYETKLVESPLVRNGRERIVAFDVDEQTVEISDSVPELERNEVLMDAAEWFTTGRVGLPRWRLVPVVGGIA